jgi:RHS repeat-associated protein
LAARLGWERDIFKGRRGGENKLKYNEKELQNGEFNDGSGLEWEDFGARMQDVQLGRWFNIDPMADEGISYSPYCFDANNPINLLDPDGRIVIDPNASKSDREALTRIVNETSGSIRSMTNREWRAFSALSGFRTRRDALAFFKINDKGPTLVAGQLTCGTGDGLDNCSGGAATLGRADNGLNVPNGGDQGTITLDRGLVDVVKDIITIEKSGDLNALTGSLAPASGYDLVGGFQAERTNAFNFIGRVFKHEITHWGATFNLGISPGADDAVKLPFPYNIPFPTDRPFPSERGRLYEFLSFGNLGAPFNPAANSSWAVARQYTTIQYQTGRTTGPVQRYQNSGNLLSADLQLRAQQFRLTKLK